MPRKPAKKKAPKSIWDDPFAGRETPHAVAIDAPEEDDPSPATGTFADVDGIAKQAAKFGPGLFGFLLWMDSRFVAQGQPALSAWWRFALNEFFESEKTWALFLVGRGGGKSTSLVRVAILYVLFGCLFAARKVPPGQRWIWPFISAHTTDAGRRINEAQALLLALGLETKPKGQHGSRMIEMVDVQQNDVAFLSIAATIAGVSGPSALGGTVDEEAKLRDRAANVNPSTEILASMVQMFRARPGVHAIRCSSAWRQAGSHHAAIVESDTDATHIARLGDDFVKYAVEGLEQVATWEAARGGEEAARAIRDHVRTLSGKSPNVPTWVANPTIGALASRLAVEATPVPPEEQSTPKWRIWLRENASVPMPGDGAVVGPTVEDYEALGAENRKFAAKRSGLSVFREDGLLTVPGYGHDFRPIPTGGRKRGL